MSALIEVEHPSHVGGSHRLVFGAGQSPLDAGGTEHQRLCAFLRGDLRPAPGAWPTLPRAWRVLGNGYRLALEPATVEAWAR